MAWSSNFYHKQVLWGGVYLGEPTAWHRRRARWVQEVLGAPPRQVLELGAGGGQDAFALAKEGFDVVAVEREPLLMAHLRQQLTTHPTPRIHLLEGDFYHIDLPKENFDGVCYWDGFGTGTDEDQRRLLRRVRTWLKPTGKALIDVFTPWHAWQSAGYAEQVGQARRRYAFDARACRWLDTWKQGNEEIVQSLRCYSPADLILLLESTGLELIGLKPGGRRDYTNGRFFSEAPLEQAMWYTAILQRRR